MVNITLSAGQANTAIVQIGAIDTQSGVRKIWYSFDGLNFDQYIEPFPVSLSSIPITIEAFADDNAANRSGLVSKTVSLSASVIPVAECIESSSDGPKVWFGYQNQTGTGVSIPVGVFRAAVASIAALFARLVQPRREYSG